MLGRSRSRSAPARSKRGNDTDWCGDRLSSPAMLPFKYHPEADRLPLATSAGRAFDLFKGGFCYLSAERSGPRLMTPRSIASANARSLGIRGDGALAVLERYRAEILADNDPRRRGQSGSLEELFQTYLSEISPNARLELQPYRDVDSIGSTFTFSAPGGLPGAPFRPTNVGFGLRAHPRSFDSC